MRTTSFCNVPNSIPQYITLNYKTLYGPQKYILRIEKNVVLLQSEFGSSKALCRG